MGFGSWASAISLKSVFFNFSFTISLFCSKLRVCVCGSVFRSQLPFREVVAPESGALIGQRASKTCFQLFCFSSHLLGREREKCPIQTQRLGRGATNFGIFVFRPISPKNGAKHRKVAIFRSVIIDTSLSCHDFRVPLISSRKSQPH